MSFLMSEVFFTSRKSGPSRCEFYELVMQLGKQGLIVWQKITIAAVLSLLMPSDIARRMMLPPSRAGVVYVRMFVSTNA